MDTAHDALVRACKIGGQAALAKRLKVSRQRLNNWLRRGLPDKWALAVSQATDGQVTPHELCPLLYPHPMDGIARSKAA